MSVFEKQTSQGLLQVFKAHVPVSRKDIQDPRVQDSQLRGRAPSSILKEGRKESLDVSACTEQEQETQP